MDPKSFLEFWLRHPDVILCYVPSPPILVVYGCQIVNVGRIALTIEGAVLWSSAVASGGFNGSCLQYFRVVLFDDAFHVVHATVTHLNSVSVKYLVVSMVLGEVFLHQFEEFLSYFSFHRFAERRVEPYNIPFPISVGPSRRNTFLC